MFQHVLSRYCLMAIVLLPALSRAQSGGENPVQLTGRVVDQKLEPVAFATVTLRRAADSSLVKGTITDEKGGYRFPVSAGNYILAASSVGLAAAYSQPAEAREGRSTTVPDIILRPNINQLSGVLVTAGKPFIEHQIDKTVVNVENSVVSTGNTALEVLEKLPGIMVDNDGNISLKGKTGITIMIDGKPTYLSQEQVINMLKSMSAAQLSQIEIITNPSAKYDAAGTAGIINIKLKKNSKEGMNGSASLGHSQGVHAKENGNINLNYKKGKINLFGNYNLSGGGQGHIFRLTRKFYSEKGGQTPVTTMSQVSPRQFSWIYNGFKAGMDYTIDSKNTVGIMVNAGFSNRKSHNGGPLNFYNSGGELDSVADAKGNTKDTWNSLTYNLNYRLAIDTAGQELTVNLDYSGFGSGSDQHYSTAYLDADGDQVRAPELRRGSLPSDIDIKSGKIDYTLPLKNKIKLETGVKSSLVTTNNNMFFEKEKGGTWQNDTGATNHFIYKENIHAAYINLNKEFKKGWGVQLGLRGEQTVSDANQITIDSIVKRNYFQLFPSIFVKKDVNKNNSLTASYSRRIDRPDYGNLNPFRYYIDDYTYGEGNPFLRPQLTNSFELTHSFKGVITTTISYSHTDDVMSNVIHQNDETHIAYETKDNLNTRDNMGISVSASVPVTRWWMSNSFANVFRNHYKGQLNGGTFNQGVTSFSFNSTNTFTLPWDMKAEISGYYNSRSIYSVWIGSPQYSVSAGIQKDLWDKKANLKLNINDIFNTQQYRGRLKYENIDMRLHNTWESRWVGLTFTYNFGNKDLKVNQHRNSGIEEEQNRINK